MAPQRGESGRGRAKSRQQLAQPRAQPQDVGGAGAAGALRRPPRPLQPEDPSWGAVRARARGEGGVITRGREKTKEAFADSCADHLVVGASQKETRSDLVVRRGEVQVARYQIWMNSRNMIWCSLRGRILRLLHERIATPDFARPIHSRLQALARMSRPAIAHTHERSEWSPDRAGKEACVGRRVESSVYTARQPRARRLPT